LSIVNVPLSFSLQSSAKRFRRLPRLFIADVGITDRGADVLVPQELLNFPQVLSHMVKEDRRGAMAEPVRRDLPHFERSASGTQPQVKRAVGKRCARIPRKHKLRAREGDPARSDDPPSFKPLLNVLPFQKRLTQSRRNWHIMKHAPLTVDAQRHNFLPYCLAIPPPKLDKLVKPACRLEEGIGQVKHESRAVALLPDLQIVEQPPNVGQEQVTDLRLLVERRVYLESISKRGLGKRGVVHLDRLAPSWNTILSPKITVSTSGFGGSTRCSGGAFSSDPTALWPIFT
jgi:hypothetical protein